MVISSVHNNDLLLRSRNLFGKDCEWLDDIVPKYKSTNGHNKKTWKSAKRQVLTEKKQNEAKSRRVSGKGEVYQIFVKGTFHMDEKTLTLQNLSPYTNINTLKDILTEKGGPPADYMYLKCATKNLEDGHTLSHYNITTESTIHMLVRARGSCSTCKA